jgi:hypothetical protein
MQIISIPNTIDAAEPRIRTLIRTGPRYVGQSGVHQTSCSQKSADFVFEKYFPVNAP